MAAVHENRQLLTTQSVRYHKLPLPRVLRDVSGTSQARLHGVLGRTSMYEMFLIITQCRGTDYREEKDKERGWWKRSGRQGRGWRGVL